MDIYQNDSDKILVIIRGTISFRSNGSFAMLFEKTVDVAEEAMRCFYKPMPTEDSGQIYENNETLVI